MLKTIGYPKITGSLMLNSPGAMANLPNSLPDFCLENRKIAINKQIVDPVPPSFRRYHGKC